MGRLVPRLPASAIGHDTTMSLHRPSPSSIRLLALGALPLLCLGASPTAQATALSGEYRFGQLFAEEGSGPCGLAAAVACVNGFGTLVFQPDGTFTGSVETASHCSGFANPSMAVDPLAGTYTLDLDGSLVLDVDPTMPGTELVPLRLSWDRQVLVAQQADAGAPMILVGIRKASGLDDSILFGSYQQVSLEQEQRLLGLWMESSSGAQVFDGLGNWIDTETFGQVGSQGTMSGFRQGAGTVSVAPDGLLTKNGDPVPRGAVTSDGRFAFWMDDFAGNGRLRLMLSFAGNTITVDPVEDDWAVANYGGEVPSGGLEALPTESSGEVSFEPAALTYNYVGIESQIASFGGSGGPDSSSGDFLLGPSGGFVLTETSGLLHFGAIGRGDDLAVIADVYAPDTTSIALLMRKWGPLTGDVDTLSVGSGGTQTLDIRAGLPHAGRPYLILGSRTGAFPGLTYGGASIPLNYDAYTLFSLTNANQSPFSATLGVLDGNGEATASISLPPGTYAQAAGSSLIHSALVFVPPGFGSPAFASNPVPLELVP